MINLLRHGGMRDRHWEELEKLCGCRVRPDPTDTLAVVVARDVACNL